MLKYLKIKKIIRFIFFLILILISLKIYNLFEIKSKSFEIIHDANKETNSKLNECNPINLSYKHFQVKINNKLYPTHYQLYRNKSINFKCLNKSKTIKKILLWTKFYNSYNDYYYGFGEIKPFINNGCPITKCEIHNNKSNLNQSDLVIFYMVDQIEQIPKFKLNNQRWIFQMYESPSIYRDFSEYKNFFNLTSTYKLNSHFSNPYESNANMRWERNINYDSTIDFFSKKKYLVSAVISNCANGKHRIDYINEMKNFIQIDVYGKCGRKKCPLNEDCKAFISKEYKFYLAFENSVCTDYITEKFFNILRHDIVPVVWGGGNYEYYVSYFKILFLFIIQQNQ